jgi:MinD superfamily P-loop ATPase
MKQLVIISGKGGTGKTTVAASFAALAHQPVLADCDVDAANLYLLLNPWDTEREDFPGARIAVRDATLCTRCGECERRCRFGAITVDRVIESHCEGCGLCVLACPHQALRLETVVNGVLISGETAYGPMVYAHLHAGAENTGRLVTRVRQEAEDVALREQRDLILLDGPPGIGCTVTASLVDTDLAIVVTEPTLSGIHDMERVVALAGQLRIPVAVIINKADINLDNTAAIRQYSEERDLPVLAELPFDDVVVKANARQQPVVTMDDGPVTAGIRQAWTAAQTFLGRSNHDGPADV